MKNKLMTITACFFAIIIFTNTSVYAGTVDLSVSVKTNYSSIAVGDVFSWDVTVTNNGPDNAGWLTRLEQLVSTEIQPIGGCPGFDASALPLWECGTSIFQLPSNNSITYTFTAKLLDVPIGGSFVTEAHVEEYYLNAYDTDPDPSNNYYTLSIPVSSVPLPAAIWFFISGVMSFGMLGFRKMSL